MFGQQKFSRFKGHAHSLKPEVNTKGLRQTTNPLAVASLSSQSHRASFASSDLSRNLAVAPDAPFKRASSNTAVKAAANRAKLSPKVTVTIAEVYDRDSDVEGNGADFYAKVWMNNSLVRNTAVFANNKNHIYPNWEFSQSYPLGRLPSTVPINIQIFDQDTVFDDQVDINPNQGETLHLFYDTTLKRITGDGISGFRNSGNWITIGENDTGDDAEIRFRIE